VERISLDPNRLNDYAENFQGEEDVEFPEMRELLGVGEDVMPVLRIKAASLDDQLRCQTLYEQVAIMAIKLLGKAEESATKGFDFDWAKMLKELQEPMNARTYLEISIFHRCVVEPKFSLRESVKISEAIPEVINRVAVKALKMSSLENLND
jgi:hypothetical protein